jgi:hypothetical protein
MGRSTRRVQTTATPERESDLTVTAAEVFPDGSVLELVRDPSAPARPALLHWDGRLARIAAEIVVDGCHYVPPEIDPKVWRCLRLPSGVLPHGSTPELFDNIRGLIMKYSGLIDYATQLTYFVFSSFFVDCLQTAPSLLLHGCADEEAIALLRLLSWFCRHPLCLADAGLSVPDYLRPTRLICQPHASTERLLAALHLPGFAISYRGSLHELSGATAIYVGEEELRSPFLDSCLRIPVTPAGQLVSCYDERREAAVIEQVQNKLLSYRLTHYGKVETSEFDVPEFGGSVRGLARTLGACIVDAPDLQVRLVELLQDHDQAVRLDRVSKIESILLEALLVCCHERRPEPHVGEIAELANDILSRHSEILTLSAREVGGKLKALGFRTTRLDSAGRGFYLLGENCKRIHELGNSYGVPSLKEGLPGCPYCQVAVSH